MVQVVSEELGTGTPSMAIINTKERTSGPYLMLAVFWLYDVQYYRYPVLVVIPYQSLISIGGICTHDSIPFVTAFGGLMVWYDDASPWSQGQVLLILYFFMDHGVSVQDGQRLDLGLLP